MLAREKLWYVLLAAVCNVAVFYACKSVKPATVALPPPPALQLRAAGIARTESIYQQSIRDSTHMTTAKTDNALPKVRIRPLDNSTFFFDKPTFFRYAVDIQEGEGKVIERENVRVAMKYIPKVSNDIPLFGYPQTRDYSYGRTLIAGSDCYSCHQPMGFALIPSFTQIAEKYWDDKKAVTLLADKIIAGGSGVWGEQVMSAHPQLSKEDAIEIVNYILSVSSQKPSMEIPKEGTEVLNMHNGTSNGGRYIFTASYTDKEGTPTPLTGKDEVVLRPSKMEAERADAIFDMEKSTTALGSINHKSHFVFQNIDLKDVNQLTFRYASKDHPATIAVHADSLGGQVICAVQYKATGSWDNYETVSAAVTDPGGKRHLYFVFLKNDVPNQNLALLDWVRFEGGNEVKVVETGTPVKSKLVKRVPLKKSASGRTIAAHTDNLPITANNRGRLLIAKSDCASCHKLNQKSIGPSYTAIAKRYNNQPSSVGRLVNKIREGGGENWGTVPMIPHPQLSETDIRAMVRYILSLKR